MEFVTLHSKNGGIIDHNNKKDIIVSTVFSGDENKFFLAQASGPLVLTGGTNPDEFPGGNSLEWYYSLSICVIVQPATFCG